MNRRRRFQIDTSTYFSDSGRVTASADILHYEIIYAFPTIFHTITPFKKEIKAALLDMGATFTLGLDFT